MLRWPRPTPATTDEDTLLTFPSSDLVSNDNGRGQRVCTDPDLHGVFDGTSRHGHPDRERHVTFTPDRQLQRLRLPSTYTGLRQWQPATVLRRDGNGQLTVNAVTMLRWPSTTRRPPMRTRPPDINVLANDTDVDERHPQRLQLHPAFSTARVTQNADGTLKYTPNANFNGPDSFTYKAKDGKPRLQRRLP